MNEINSSNRLIKHLDKILFILASFYLVIGTLWLVSQNQLKSSSLTQKDTATVNHQLSESDAQFIAYMLDSLKAIAQKPSTKSENPTPSTPVTQNPSSAITSYPLKKSTLSTPLYRPPIPQQPTTTIIEKIYIPIAPKPQTQSPVTAAAGNNKSNPYPNPVVPPPPPIPAAANSPVTLPPVEKLTSVPVISSNQTISSSSLPEVSPQGSSYNLVGILDSGEKSAALFNSNGITHRIQLGEEIGTSGWFLLSISNQQAIIHRNDQVHYMNVGEMF